MCAVTNLILCACVILPTRVLYRRSHNKSPDDWVDALLLLLLLIQRRNEAVTNRSTGSQTNTSVHPKIINKYIKKYCKFFLIAILVMTQHQY